MLVLINNRRSSNTSSVYAAHLINTQQSSFSHETGATFISQVKLQNNPKVRNINTENVTAFSSPVHLTAALSVQLVIQRLVPIVLLGNIRCAIQRRSWHGGLVFGGRTVCGRCAWIECVVDRLRRCQGSPPTLSIFILSVIVGVGGATDAAAHTWGRWSAAVLEALAVSRLDGRSKP
jgi:hypothetical protein